MNDQLAEHLESLVDQSHENLEAEAHKWVYGDYKPNPKLVDTLIVDCIPQEGNCPVGCNQCFYNRPGAFYCNTPNVPTQEDVGNKLVRMNCGHDSNIKRELVIKTAEQFKFFFFNTSIPNFDFPGPVVFTANAKEEEPAKLLSVIPENLMFVRLRVSSTNLQLVDTAVHYYTGLCVPVVLTFMAYYDNCPNPNFYEWKVRHVNSYWCPTVDFMKMVKERYYFTKCRIVSVCGSYEDGYCRSCRNCETYYVQTVKRMRGE